MIKYNYQRFKNGEVQFRVFNLFATSVIQKTFTLVPYKIVYVERHINRLHIFNCKLNLMNTLLSVSDIELAPRAKGLLNNSELRFLLGRTIETAENLAKNSDKTKVVVSSSIEGIIDVFVEKDYVFRDRKVLGIKGVKKLNLKTYKGNA